MQGDMHLKLASTLALVALAELAGTHALAQSTSSARPSLGPVVPSAEFRAALNKQTRSATGQPGPRYWQNSADYKINARIDPASKRLEGSVQITYRNHSPDTLKNLQLDLTQNFHRAEAIRNEPAEITGGVELRSVTVNGQALAAGSAGPRYQVLGTRLVILPPAPVAPKQSVTIAIDYNFNVPQAGAGERMGWSKDNFFFIAYWYPQMAVYDDVVGWHPDQFVGTTEFYSDFARYDYTIDMPAGWVLIGTGNLANARDVLAPDVYARLQRAEASDQPVAVIARENLGFATNAGTNGRLQWHFTADSVRDVTFSATRASLWDAMRTAVGDRNGDGRTDYTRVDAVYRESAPRWQQSARYSAHAMTFLSRFTGLPYPWPHMTAVEGEDIISGGMEFPMMTLIGPYTDRGDDALYAVTVHEEAHMWYPMMISIDERRYSWLDEGTTEFNENQGEKDFHRITDARYDIQDQEGYLGIVRAGEEGEVMRRSAYHYSPAAYGVATYEKPASVLVALRAVLGDSVFMSAFHEFGRRWQFRHPYPWDMWSTFEQVSGRDLDWFWQAWYNTTWVLDHAIESVTTSGATTIVVADRGQVPMPVFVTITRANGETSLRQVPVETWLNGATRATLTVPSGAAITRIELDARRAYPDIDRTNNIWPRP